MKNRFSVCEAFTDFALHVWIIAKAPRPFDASFVAKPTQLTLGIMTHVQFRLFDRALKCATAAQIFDHASITMRAERV